MPIVGGGSTREHKEVSLIPCLSLFILLVSLNAFVFGV